MTTWVAVFALLCHVLLPMLAQAGMRSDLSRTTLLCTTTGFQLIAIGDAGPTTVPDTALHVQPCPYCLNSHCAAPPPASDPAFIPAAPGGKGFGPATSTAAGPSPGRAAAQPRGPPPAAA